MKKFLSTALALGMVAGLAATASAMELKLTGKYVVDGYYIDQGNGAAGGGGVWPFKDDGAEADSWYQHTFRLYPDFVINDKLTMKSELRLIAKHTIWGSQDDGNVSDGNNMELKLGWLVWDSPAGKVEIGRRPAGAWQGAFVNSATNADRIMWNFPAMDNFKGYAFLEKQTEQDAYDWAMENNDKDYYEVAGGYEAEGVKAWLGLGYQQDNLLDDAVFGLLESDKSGYRVKGYGEFTINPTFSVASEFDYKWGDTDYASAFIEDKDFDGFAILVSGIGKFDALTASLHYAYMSGDDPTSYDAEAYDTDKGMGADFEPLYILTGNATNILNGDRGPNAVGSAVRTAGAHAVVFLADYKASEDLTLHGGIGWGQADETPAGVDDNYGWEFDLGLGYNLYQNLTYELHFGWWAVGDFAELGGLTDTEDVLLLSHHLSMKF